MQANTHNRQMSIAKGIGISLMVLGHSGCPDYLHNFIYCFHMVLFYYLSGFFSEIKKYWIMQEHICGGRFVVFIGHI